MRDPLFLLSCSLYLLNRAVIQPRVSATFFHSWCNDLLLIPCALPVALALHRCFALRPHDDFPGWAEVAGHCAGWAALSEGVAPHLFTRATGDLWDLAAYGAGAMISCCWWQARRMRRA